MSYAGYSIKIDGTVVPNAAVVPGSYSLTSELRVKKKYQSGTGVTKFKYYNRGPQHTITFTVHPSTEEEQTLIRNILAQKYNRTVSYYDDDTGTYAEGSFWIKAVTWTHAYENGEKIFYDTTKVTLIEY